MKINSIISTGAPIINSSKKNKNMSPALTAPISNTQYTLAECTANFNRANINFGLKLNTDDYDLSKIKLNPFFRTRGHGIFIYSQPMSHNRTYTEGSWKYFNSKNQEHCAWKMHIYSDTETDYQKLCTLLAPYLRKNDITWKTYASIGGSIEDLGGIQKGKAITIYPHNNDEFSRLAHDINFIIKNNNLETNNSNIQGDRSLGNSGRIFYRYEYNSGRYKDTILDMDTDEEYRKYRMIYEPARSNGNHLADDMSFKDDPWLNFNPDTDGAKDD